MLHRLEKSTLTPEDFEYIRDQQEFIDEVTRTEQGWWNGGQRDGKREGIEQGIKIGEERSEEKLQLKTMEIAREMKRKGMDVEVIADCTGLTVKEIEVLKVSKP